MVSNQAGKGPTMELISPRGLHPASILLPELDNIKIESNFKEIRIFRPQEKDETGTGVRGPGHLLPEKTTRLPFQTI